MTLQEYQKKIRSFVTKRDWKQFHNPKDVAISLSLEASEYLEHFQWKTNEEIELYSKTHRKEIAEELADVLYWVLLASMYLEIDILKAAEQKLKVNEKRYPVMKAKGKATKYTKL